MVKMMNEACRAGADPRLKPRPKPLWGKAWSQICFFFLLIHENAPTASNHWNKEGDLGPFSNRQFFDK
jgi:hypothetical protein